jgi:hypothetical protein
MKFDPSKVDMESIQYLIARNEALTKLVCQLVLRTAPELVDEFIFYAKRLEELDTTEDINDTLKMAYVHTAIDLDRDRRENALSDELLQAPLDGKPC